VKCHIVISLVVISRNNGGCNQCVAGSVVQIKLESARVIPNGANKSLDTQCCLQFQGMLCQCEQKTRCRNKHLRATAQNQGKENRWCALPKIVLVYTNLHICTRACPCTICRYQKNKKAAASVVHIKTLYIKTRSLPSLRMLQYSSPLKTTAPIGKWGVLTALLHKMWTHRLTSQSIFSTCEKIRNGTNMPNTNWHQMNTIRTI
jgi:hypothetical protein